MRASTVRGLSIVKQKVFDAAQGAAPMAGARLEIEEGLTYAERNNNLTLAEDFWNRIWTFWQVGGSARPLSGKGFVSSDIGNVSQITAAIHPYTASACRRAH